jgi:hypothetical protein
MSAVTFHYLTIVEAKELANLNFTPMIEILGIDCINPQYRSSERSESHHFVQHKPNPSGEGEHGKSDQPGLCEAK